MWNYILNTDRQRNKNQNCMFGQPGGRFQDEASNTNQTSSPTNMASTTDALSTWFHIHHKPNHNAWQSHAIQRVTPKWRVSWHGGTQSQWRLHLYHTLPRLLSTTQTPGQSHTVTLRCETHTQSKWQSSHGRSKSTFTHPDITFPYSDIFRASPSSHHHGTYNASC